LAAACAAFAERHLFCAFSCRLIPARTVFAGALIPRARTIAGRESGDRRHQPIREGQQGDDNPYPTAHRTVLLEMMFFQGAAGARSIAMLPKRSRPAAAPGGTMQVPSYSSTMQGPIRGSARSARLRTLVSRQPCTGPK